MSFDFPSVAVRSSKAVGNEYCVEETAAELFHDNVCSKSRASASENRKQLEMGRHSSAYFLPKRDLSRPFPLKQRPIL
ncbi:hypothetical protein Y032_0274g1012 [Ancylostoma ceylanicum]|uniref:Uncharacterized protein n=1 Tax=Ancylostoma ceylanicum TaxID=53326 RepID=A0A016S8B7_9BILA|nr:hypothetical protein Y032_0274g1012 [Ancylostoma ceylanicum]